MGETKKEATPKEQPSRFDESIIPQSDNSVTNDTVSGFFRTLYGESAAGWLTIWTLQDKKTTYLPVSDFEAITKACERLSKKNDVYFGVGLRKSDLGEWERGKAESVASIPGLWLDVDCKGGVHSASDLPKFEEVASFIKETFPLSPTLAVHSGGGMHLYWLFDQLFTIEDETQRTQVAGLLEQFQHIFIQAAAAKGWKLDNTSDLPRVLRVAGTYNHKNSKKAPVKMLGSSANRRYSIDTLDEVIKEAHQRLAVETSSKQVGATRELRVFKSTDSALPSASQIMNGCGFIKHCAENSHVLSEPEWYKMLTVIARTDMGSDLCHDLSRPHPGYSEKETESKIQHALGDSGPITCEKIQADHGDSWCRNCAHNKKVKSPISLGTDRIQTARNTVNDALIKARNGDVGAPLDGLVIGALALIEKEDPADFARVKLDLKKAKVPLTEINRALKQAKRERLRLVGPGDTLPTKTAGDMIDDCPVPHLIIPEQYNLTETRVYRSVVKNAGREDQSVTQVPVALAPVVITGLYKDISTGKESLRVAWKKPGAHKWLDMIVDREVAANSRSIVTLAGGGFPVNSGSAGELTDYLALLEADNMQRLPIAFVTNQLGWQGKDGSKGFLLGRTLINAEGEAINDLNMDELTPGEWREDLVSFKGIDDGEEQLADGFHSRGSIDVWMEAIKTVSDYPKALLAFYTAFVPPLLQILRCDSFLLEYAKRTSTGKSVTQRVAASVMGNPDERSADSVFHTWDITEAWLGRAGSVLTGLPLILDDTKRAKSPEFVASAIYTITSGKDKGRGTLKGLGITRTWRTVVISSGEVKSTSFTKDGGIKGRVLTITTLPFDGGGPETKRLVERLNQIVTMNYGHAMPLFLKYVMRNKEHWAAWEAAFRDENAKYASRSSGDVAGRLAKYAAAIDVTAALVHAAFRDMGHPLPFQYRDPFANGLWETIANESEDATGEEEALREVYGWAMYNETSFLGRHQEDLSGRPKQPNNGWLGKWENGAYQHLSIYPDRLKRFLREQNHDPEQILAGWKERGWLAVDKGYQKQIRLDGGKPYMICVTREAIESV